MKPEAEPPELFVIRKLRASLAEDLSTDELGGLFPTVDIIGNRESVEILCKAKPQNRRYLKLRLQDCARLNGNVIAA